MLGASTFYQNGGIHNYSKCLYTKCVIARRRLFPLLPMMIWFLTYHRTANLSNSTLRDDFRVFTADGGTEVLAQGRHILRSLCLQDGPLIEMVVIQAAIVGQQNYLWKCCADMGVFFHGMSFSRLAIIHGRHRLTSFE